MSWPELCSTQISLEPQKAPPNYRELPPCVILKNGQCHGSGVPLRQVPIFDYPWQATYTQACGACGHQHTRCIFASARLDISGKWDVYELECLECGRYTTYQYS